MATAERQLTGARWSSAVTCPRRAYYQHVGAPTNPATDGQTERYRKRGNIIGDAIRDELIAEYRAEGRAPRREEVIPWPREAPIGEGHADVYLPHEKAIVEIKSRVGSELDDAAALQVAGYVVNHPAAEKGYVLSVDPSSLQERLYPIDVAGLEPRVREIEQTILTAIATDTPSERVCRYPGDGPSIFCDHSDHCFQDWEAPEVDVVIGVDVSRLADAEQTVREAKQAVKEAEQDRDELRASLRPWFVPGEKVECGDYDVLVTQIEASPRLSLADVAKAGHKLPEELDAFVKWSGAHERWSLRRRTG